MTDNLTVYLGVLLAAATVISLPLIGGRLEVEDDE